MHEEAGFLSVIRQSPADNTARLVFADWLDEQDDPNCKIKADFIRLELRVADAPEQSLDRTYGQNQLRQRAARIDSLWLATISNPPIEAHRTTHPDTCPKQWKLLTPTAAPQIRHCETCQHCVHYCDSLLEARHLATNEIRFALALTLANYSDDLYLSLVFAPVASEERERRQQIEEERDRARRTEWLAARVGFTYAVLTEQRYGGRGRAPVPLRERSREERLNRRSANRSRRCNIDRESWEETD
ncbi:hypothetical protein VT84_30215 [Gemmata sp. SH-PL17]|uniref:TIGR02996 domain-containing protein n=1 Tax=Gemmata sp. SH-PL17 TaxID=1630693 RepID=UPI00078C6E1B|nr:TIGR02996 domain-containing protein [Gemmata sp. SH-PL17]AMV28719.1 hypothetical protein VT84_30215 [Gemmata sp. SH-PL17]